MPGSSGSLGQPLRVADPGCGPQPIPAAGPDIDGVPGPHLGYVSSFILSVSPTKCDAYQVTSCSRQCAAGSSLVPHRPWQPAEDRRTS
jgi:hypothetical protein